MHFDDGLGQITWDLNNNQTTQTQDLHHNKRHRRVLLMSSVTVNSTPFSTLISSNKGTLHSLVIYGNLYSSNYSGLVYRMAHIPAELSSQLSKPPRNTQFVTGAREGVLYPVPHVYTTLNLQRSVQLRTLLSGHSPCCKGVATTPMEALITPISCVG